MHKGKFFSDDQESDSRVKFLKTREKSKGNRYLDCKKLNFLPAALLYHENTVILPKFPKNRKFFWDQKNLPLCKSKKHW